MSPVVCALCSSLHDYAKKEHWWQWMCTKHPLPQQYNPVTGQTVADPPFMRCKSVNDGNCTDFEEGPNCLHPVGEE